MQKVLLLLMLVFSSQAFACKVSDLTLSSTSPIDGAPFELKIKTFTPTNEFNKQVIILPPIGGVTTLESKYANKICARGAAAYVFVNWTNDMEQSVDDLAVHGRGTLRGLFAVELFLKNYKLPTRILGTSLGGVYAGVAAGKFNLIEKVAIIASGTNLSHILATSTLPDLVNLKKLRFTHFHFNNDSDYAQAIKNNLPIEAENFKSRLSNKKLLFMKTNGDSVIKPQYQNELVQLFLKENRLVYTSRLGHTKGIIMFYVRRSNLIANFLAN